jgi:endonuclease/exonuclease/phosphatase family metal-dependent hydrolase
MDAGLLVLSRYPMVTAENCLFKRSAHSDRVAAKGVLYVKLELGTQSLHLFNTHMQAFYSRHDEQAIAVKAAQTRELAAFVTQLTKDDREPVLMCGDFNINSRPDPKGDGSELVE